MRKLFLLALLLPLFAGCGFHLRGAVDMPFDTLYIKEAPGTGAISQAIARGVNTGSQAKVVTKEEEAQVVLNILSNKTEKRILSLGGGGKVREYQLAYYLTFSATRNGEEVIREQQIELRRDMTYDDTQALAKQYEESMLYQNMQDDAVQQVLRRLKGAVASGSAAPR